MRISSDDKRSWIDLSLHDVAPQKYAPGDRELSVSVSAFGFTGIDVMWVRAEAIINFLSELETLEARRKGVAKLLSMDAEAGSDSVINQKVVLYSLDHVGHIGVRATVGRQSYLRDTPMWLATSAAFEIDPSTLPAVLEEIRKLLVEAPVENELGA